MKLFQRVMLGGVIAAMCMQAGALVAQESNKTDNAGSGRRNRGNFDPAQFQQRMLENIRTKLDFTNNDEWAAVQPLVQKVLDARRDTMQSGGFGRMGGRPGENNSNASGENRSSPFKGSPEAESLQKLIDDKVPTAEIKAALEKYRVAHKDKDAKLAAAQEELRKVLTLRQEAQASLLGLVP